MTPIQYYNIRLAEARAVQLGLLSFDPKGDEQPVLLQLAIVEAQIAHFTEAARFVLHGIMEKPVCDQCSSTSNVHKVKYADDTGVGSMLLCDSCDDR